MLVLNCPKFAENILSLNKLWVLKQFYIKNKIELKFNCNKFEANDE